MYKVCGIEGCFDSDSAAAVEQAILDGVNVINFSISGGTNPATDPVELAFLDAYAAGVFVAASAGNDGPGAGTANHLSPWVDHGRRLDPDPRVPVDAHRDAAGGATATFVGASITAGVDRARCRSCCRRHAPYQRPLCDAPAAAGHLHRARSSPASAASTPASRRASTSLQGGAAGMVLYNPTLADIETDNHWLPTVHLADGTDFVAFMTANPGVDGVVHRRREGRRPGRRDGGVLLARARPASSSSRTSPHPACRSSPATRRCRRAVARRPARRVLPGDRRHLDVVAAHRRFGDPAQGPAPVVDAGPDQVGADDDGDDRRRQGGPRRRRPIRSTSAPAGSTSTSPATPA